MPGDTLTMADVRRAQASAEGVVRELGFDMLRTTVVQSTLEVERVEMGRVS